MAVVFSFPNDTGGHIGWVAQNRPRVKVEDEDNLTVHRIVLFLEVIAL